MYTVHISLSVSILQLNDIQNMALQARKQTKKNKLCLLLLLFKEASKALFYTYKLKSFALS